MAMGGVDPTEGAPSDAERTARHGMVPFAVMLPLAIIYTAYLGFTTNYTAHVFGVNSFLHQYERGIFRYRVLGRSIQIVIYDIIKKIPLPDLVNRGVLLDPAFSPAFYYSYMINNGIFLILSSIAIWRRLNRLLAPAEALRIYLVVLFLVTLSLSVVTPYDQLAYFLLVLAVVIFDAEWRGARLALLAVIMMGTLNRETSALDLAYFFVLAALPERPGQRRERFLRLGIAIVAYVGVYGALRLYYGLSHAVLQEITFDEQNVKDYAGLGLTAVLYFVLLTALPRPSTGSASFLRRRVALLYLSCLPYLVAVFVGGLWFEIRLWIPVAILHALLVAKTIEREAADRSDQAATV